MGCGTTCPADNEILDIVVKVHPVASLIKPISHLLMRIQGMIGAGWAVFGRYFQHKVVFLNGDTNLFRTRILGP